MASIRSQVKREVERIEKYARKHHYLRKGFFLDIPELRTKAGTERKSFTKKQLEALASVTGKDVTKYIKYVTPSGEVLPSYQQGLAWIRAEKRSRELRVDRYVRVDQTIIANFLDERNWAHHTPSMMEFIHNWVTGITSQRGGTQILAKALQDARNDGVMQEVQTYSYNKNVQEAIYTRLDPYVADAAEYFNLELEQYQSELSAEIDDQIANEDFVEDIE